MEKDIKVLEKYVEKDIPCNSCKYCTERPKVAGALRNLIKRNKELEELLEEKTIRVGFENKEDYIPKSKVREKIEEYRYLMQNPKEAEHYVAWYGRRIDILQELLEERN